MNLGNSGRWILCVALAVCVLQSEDGVSIASPFADVDSVQAEAAAAGCQVAGEPDRRLPEKFLVVYHGYALLGPDGKETEHLESIANAAGAISPDGRWVLFSESGPSPVLAQPQNQLVIQSMVHAAERRIVPMIWGTTGSSFLPLWSSDSKRILVCEQGQNPDGSRGSAYRVYDLELMSVTRLKVSGEWWPSDWSADGKRLLTSLRGENGCLRVAWVSIDGAGEPEFLTSDQESAYGARVSPDNRRILCKVGPNAANDEGRQTRLYVIDLATKKRTVIDKPGHTESYCWSSDGSKVAYTWQMPIRQPDEVVDRKSYLITSDADGSNQKTVTMRKYDVPQNSSGRNGVISFFRVLGWWR